VFFAGNFVAFAGKVGDFRGNLVILGGFLCFFRCFGVFFGCFWGVFRNYVVFGVGIIRFLLVFVGLQ